MRTLPCNKICVCCLKEWRIRLNKETSNSITFLLVFIRIAERTSDYECGLIRYKAIETNELRNKSVKTLTLKKITTIYWVRHSTLDVIGKGKWKWHEIQRNFNDIRTNIHRSSLTTVNWLGNPIRFSYIQFPLFLFKHTRCHTATMN